MRLTASLPMRLSGTSRSVSPLCPGFDGRGSNGDRAHDHDAVAVEDHSLHVSQEKLPVRVEVGASLQAGLGRCAELPDTCVYKFLVLS
jgi:hypothetical protein